ncbi:hypothetical protein AB4559_12430 [Vibrio sp. 10N.222.51.C8]|uniref:hypothetical protein n=1 Tax=unclassified Vibrio TaxID=2614977 RepID=UPI000C8305F1|nr:MULTISPECIES: hypothetical protein [unclassified Vibrio]PMK19734.1 hypothetical protein BCU05_16350 [Vibrio sp. 10N.261.54.C3]PMN99330.1 hypothetical protein BCT21_12395 [Vibrio sp. 10N.222.55.F9]PMO02086.1 hypothetical protein BCT20_11280 [Vibrio sp. 10N.222.55.C12]PMO12089.1 hypothetical protein BCT17_15875 [Vibrio sp. 10N.222.54.F10]PMO14141.1 hypothetical protein BCT16_20115 [Vibrio sp. 10N.222.54.B6]
MMRNLLIFIVSLFFLTACSSTSNHQLDDETLSNEDAMSKSIEGESNLETSKDTNAETSVDSSHDSIVDHQPLTNLDSNKDTIAHANAEPESVEPSQIEATETTESDAKSGGEKGIGSYFIRHNKPTKTVIKSLEGVTDALNVMTFGIFATGNG